MLVEKNVNDALIDYTKGRKVVVLQCAQDGRIDANLLSDFLEDDQVKYLVDVPAYSNPDFEDAIRGMAESAKVPEDHPDPKPESEEQLPPLEEPEEAVILPAKKTKRETVLELKESGLTVQEIVEKTGYKYGSVYNYYNGFDKKRSNQEKMNDVTPGYNADRHLCKTCRFRGKQNGKNNCDYIEHNKKRRGCKVEDCNVYEEGDPKPIE